MTSYLFYYDVLGLMLLTVLEHTHTKKGSVSNSPLFTPRFFSSSNFALLFFTPTFRLNSFHLTFPTINYFNSVNVFFFLIIIQNSENNFSLYGPFR